MGLQQLNDSEYETLKSQGVSGLSDDAYRRLKLPDGYGVPQSPTQAPPASNTAFGAPIHNTMGVEWADPTIPIANMGKTAADYLKSQANETEQDLANSGPLGNVFGKTVGGITKAGASIIPQTPTQVKANIALPFASEAASLGAKAFAGTELGQSAINTASSVVQGLSKLPANLVSKVINDPEILNRYLPVEQAGQLMSDFFTKLGLKSGYKALEGPAEDMGKAAPTIGSFGKFADDTVQKIKNMPDLLAQNEKISAQANDLGRQMIEAKEKLNNSSTMDAFLPEGQKPLDEYNKLVKDAHDQLGQMQVQMVKNGLAMPNAQDALAARQYLSKITSKQAFTPIENQVVNPIAQNNLKLVDQYLDDEVDRLTNTAVLRGTMPEPMTVPGYGEVKTPQQLRDIYHESKIGEAFSSLVPTNRNGQADALRTTLGVLSKNPAALLQSPQLWKQGILAARGLTNSATASKAALAGTAMQNLMKGSSDEESK